MPLRVRNSTPRSSTESSGTERRSIAITGASGPSPRIDDVPQPVAHQIEAEHRSHQHEPREERHPPFARDDEAGSFGDHDAPFGGRRTHAEADERQAGGVEDGIAE